MTQALRLTPLREFIPLTYSEGSYRMTIEDFPDGCAVKTDALSGRQWACGRNVFGEMISVPLNVPICSSCDQPITGHICPACEYVFVEEDGQLRSVVASQSSHSSVSRPKATAAIARKVN